MFAFISSISIATIKYYDVPLELLENYLHYQKMSYPNHYLYDPPNLYELLNSMLIPFYQSLIDFQSSKESFHSRLYS